MNRWTILALLIIIIAVVGLAVWYGDRENARTCAGAGYDDYHETLAGGAFCVYWQEDGHKVLVPFGEIE